MLQLMYLDTFQQLPEDLFPKIAKVASIYSLNHQSSSIVSLHIHATIGKGILVSIVEQGHGHEYLLFLFLLLVCWKNRLTLFRRRHRNAGGSRLCVGPRARRSHIRHRLQKLEEGNLLLGWIYVVDTLLMPVKFIGSAKGLTSLLATWLLTFERLFVL
jgi:hypothetical protein